VQKLDIDIDRKTGTLNETQDMMKRKKKKKKKKKDTVSRTFANKAR